MTRAETLRREIEARELSHKTREVRRKALEELALLQEKAVQELHDSERQAKLRAMSEPQKAAANAVWARQALGAASTLLQMTNGRVEFSGTFLGRSAINGEVIIRNNHQTLELAFNSEVIPSGEEDIFLQHVYEDGFRGGRRNVDKLASLTPLEVIGKVYSAVYRI